MKYLLVNSVIGIGSTGRICANLAQQLESQGNEVKIAYGRSDTVPEKYKKYAVKIGTDYDRKMHALRTRILDEHGFGSVQATKIFLEWAEHYKPDVLWLHNIHGYYVNVEMLFEWIKRYPNMQVKWTLHDCWAFTGHCSYFTAVKCNQWKRHCVKCPQLRQYPKCYLKSNVSKNYERKKVAFTGVGNLELIVPSKWLEDLVKQSFLREYPVHVEYNTIDANIFKPTQSTFRERFNIESKTIVLGAANIWAERKGLNDILKLSSMLDDRYVIVMVGLSQKQIKALPNGIIGITHTNSPMELAEIYTVADVFVNLTYEDNYPTVNLEARACGTPVVTYNAGGSPESAGEDAIVVEPGDIEGVVDGIEKIVGRKVEYT